MGSNDHVDFELSERLDAIVEAGYLEAGTAAAGIAKLVSNAGTGVLSEKQKYVYETVIIPALSNAGKDGLF